MIKNLRGGINSLSRRCRGIVAEFAKRLGALHARRPSVVDSALRDYATAYWPSFGCPVFKGFHFASHAKKVLKLLLAMGIPQIRVICFAPKDSAVAARWERLLGWPRKRMTFRNPPNNSSQAARSWIAIDALFPVIGKGGQTSFKAASGFPTLMIFAARMAYVLDSRAAVGTAGTATGEESRPLQDSGS